MVILMLMDTRKVFELPFFAKEYRSNPRVIPVMIGCTHVKNEEVEVVGTSWSCLKVPPFGNDEAERGRRAAVLGRLLAYDEKIQELFEKNARKTEL